MIWRIKINGYLKRKLISIYFKKLKNSQKADLKHILMKMTFKKPQLVFKH